MTHRHAPRVFISYSHDSEEHAQRVLALANRLRTDGVDAIIDQYEPSPPEGWPRWIEKQIGEADFILLLCTAKYARLFYPSDATSDLGVRYEGQLIYQSIYNAGKRFIPILDESGTVELIPPPLRGNTWYSLDAKEGYEDLYRRITDQPRVMRPALGRTKPLPPRNRSWRAQRPQDVVLAALFNVPDLPKGARISSEHLSQLRTALLNARHKPSTSNKFGLCGPATGKTTLALAVARDEQIGKVFIDGIFWVSLGHDCDALSRQTDLIWLLSRDQSLPPNTEHAKGQLSGLFARKSCLLVLDDVCSVEDGRAFDVIEPPGVSLLTARCCSLIENLNAVKHTIGNLPSSMKDK